MIKDWSPRYCNCLVWAVVVYAALLMEPRRKGLEPYIQFRRSRVDGGVLHALVGEPCVETGAVLPMSYVPVAPREHAWFLPPIIFEGRVKRGDLHDNIIPGPMPAWEARLERAVNTTLRAVAGAMLLAAACAGITFAFQGVGSVVDNAGLWFDVFTRLPML